MAWLNYHHLYYFWTIAREGTIARAAKKLGLGQPTLSAQLKTLEDSLGRTLFDRTKGRLALSDSGRIALEYADEIFRLGEEMMEVHGRMACSCGRERGGLPAHHAATTVSI